MTDPNTKGTVEAAADLAKEVKPMKIGGVTLTKNTLIVSICLFVIAFIVTIIDVLLALNYFDKIHIKLFGWRLFTLTDKYHKMIF